MATAFGTGAYIGFGEEVTYGTSVTRTKFLEILEESITAKTGLAAKPTLRSASQRYTAPMKKAVEGSFKFNFPLTGAERLIKHAMGSNATTGTNPYTHTASLANALPVGLSIEVNRDSSGLGGGSTSFLYEGCQITKFTLSQAVEDLLTCQCDIVGEDFSLVSATSASFPTFSALDWSMLTGTANSAGTTLKMLDFELTIENGLATDRYIMGQLIRKGLGRNSARKVSGKFTVEMDDVTSFYTWYATSLTKDLSFVWTSGSSSLTITVPKAKFNNASPATKDAGPIQIPVEWEALVSSADNDELSIVTVNTTSTI